MATKPQVACQDYRAEQRLLSLKRQLADPALHPDRREPLLAEIAQLEHQLKMD